MSYQCQILPEHQLGHLCFSGELRATTFIEGLQTLYGDVAWRPGFSALWDFSLITSLLVLPDDMDDMVEAVHAISSRMGHGRAVFIVSRVLDEEIAKLLLARTRNPERQRHICYTHAAALAWLELPKTLSGELVLPCNKQKSGCLARKPLTKRIHMIR